MTRRYIGALLLAVGIALAIVGGVLWANENRRVSRANDSAAATADFAQALGNSAATFAPITPNHGPSVVLWVTGTAAGLFGMLLVAVPAGTAGSNQVPASTGDLTGELERLARLHSNGSLTDDQYEQAKSRALSKQPPNSY